MIVPFLICMFLLIYIYKELQKTNRLLVSINSYQTNSIGVVTKLREAVKLALSILDLEEGCPGKAITQEDLNVLKAALADSGTTIPRPPTEQEIEDGKAVWCSVCTTDCPDKGKNLLCVCGRFKESEAHDVR